MSLRYRVDLLMPSQSLIKRAFNFLVNTSLHQAAGYLRDPSTFPPIHSPTTIDDVIPACLFLCPAGTTEDEVRAVRRELHSDHDFYQELNERYLKFRGERLSERSDWLEILYVYLRIARPKVMVETGVFDGLSTSFFLRAFIANGEGVLISVDLPAVNAMPASTDQMMFTRLPPGQQPGWLIPDSLRDRHRLYLGDSKDLLPKVLREYPQIDVFLHDSLHTFDHMLFEFGAAWPALRSGGCLLTDDVNWNRSFGTFARKHGLQWMRFRYKLGAIVKPTLNGFPVHSD
jgi:predicted O-methyltransferase YrrM